jgi:hypothetical protein
LGKGLRGGPTPSCWRGEPDPFGSEPIIRQFITTGECALLLAAFFHRHNGVNAHPSEAFRTLGVSGRGTH